jgi:oxygen-dependent protoporphyrinogen oxidase
MRKKIAIIGGGITGLSTAFFLQEKLKEKSLSPEIILIESDNRLGGKIVSERVGDFMIEGGPDSFLSQKPWGLTLCRKLGLMDKIVQTHPIDKAIYILSHGKLQPFPEGMNLMVPGKIAPFLWTPLVSPAGKARMGLDLLIPKKQTAEEESIGAFVRRRLGEEAVTTFAEPILATIYAGDVEKLSLQATFPQFSGMEEKFGSLIWGGWMRRWDTHLAKKTNKQTEGQKQAQLSLFVSLKDGLSSLIQSLQAQIKDVTIKTGQPVISVSPKQNQYEIVLPDEKLQVDAVVMTASATTAAGFIKPWDDALSAHLAAIPYVSTATVSLGFRREDVAHPLNGFGYVVPRSERKTILATTWSSSKFEGRANQEEVLIRSFVGGAHQEEMVDRSDTELADTVFKECQPILGISGGPIVSRVYKWKKANPQYNMGHLLRVGEIEKASAKHGGFFLAGAAYKGVGIPDCIQQGSETAEKIIGFLKGIL